MEPASTGDSPAASGYSAPLGGGPLRSHESQLAGREWHIVGHRGLGETLQGERTNLFGCDAPF
jgi:hypothetical protein